MRIYRSAWRATGVALVGISVIWSVATLGWLALAVAAACSAALGVMFSLARVSDPGAQRHAMARSATWCGSAGVLIAGLPGLLGLWSLLVMTLLGGLAPDLLAAGRRAVQAPRPTPPAKEPTRSSDRDLERRWRRTTEELPGRWRAPATVLSLVDGPARLLDELERRDPERFAAWLVRAGWRQPQDS